jgi:hypothetical protein
MLAGACLQLQGRSGRCSLQSIAHCHTNSLGRWQNCDDRDQSELVCPAKGRIEVLRVLVNIAGRHEAVDCTVRGRLKGHHGEQAHFTGWGRVNDSIGFCFFSQQHSRRRRVVSGQGSRRPNISFKITDGVTRKLDYLRNISMGNSTGTQNNGPCSGAVNDGGFHANGALATIKD